MIREAIRVLTDALNDPTIGVNAQLAGLDLDGDDTPADLTLIADESRNDAVAVRMRPDADYPMMLVTTLGTVDSDTRLITDVEDGEVTFHLTYLADAQETAKGRTDLSHTMRATRKTLCALFDSSNDASRVKNGVQVISLEAISYLEPVTFKETTNIVGALQVTIRCRDFALNA